jgi:AraC family transcriptional regulator
MDVRLETLDPIRVAYLRASGPYQTTLPTLWKRMSAEATRRGLWRPGAWMLTIANGDPRITPADQIKSDACITVDEDFVADGDLPVQTIPGGLHAVYRYVGPYEGLGQAWVRLADEWLPTSGYRPRRLPGFEVYRNTPRDVPPSELVTEIYEPVEAVG